MTLKEHLASVCTHPRALLKFARHSLISYINSPRCFNPKYWKTQLPYLLEHITYDTVMDTIVLLLERDLTGSTGSAKHITRSYFTSKFGHELLNLLRNRLYTYTSKYSLDVTVAVSRAIKKKARTFSILRASLSPVILSGLAFTFCGPHIFYTKKRARSRKYVRKDLVNLYARGIDPAEFYAVSGYSEEEQLQHAISVPASGGYAPESVQVQELEDQVQDSGGIVQISRAQSYNSFDNFILPSDGYTENMPEPSFINGEDFAGHYIYTLSEVCV